ncbi:MAG: tyrosine recombinase XerC [Pseudomonadota bacterium]
MAPAANPTHDRQTLADRFLRSLAGERRLSGHTLDAYRRDLAKFDDFCRDENLSTWQDVNAWQLRRFAAAMHRKGLSARSIARRLSTLRSFFGFLTAEGILDANPAADVSAPKVNKRLPGVLDADAMAALLSIETGDDILAIRDLAIMELFYSSGLRLAELTALELPDIDRRDRLVRVTGKGRKERIVPVGKSAMRALDRWLGRRHEFVRNDTRNVFLARTGKALSRRSVQARVLHWAKHQGVPARVHPHLFRHSCASHVLESSGNLRGVQELLGHANISTTQVYTHLDFQHLAQVYDRAHPRAKRSDKHSEKRDD